LPVPIFQYSSSHSQYLGSYKSGNGRKSQKEPLPSRKKSKTKHPKPITRDRIANDIGTAAKSKSSAIDNGSPLTT